MQTPQLLAALEIPETINVLGSAVDLSPLRYESEGHFTAHCLALPGKRSASFAWTYLVWLFY